MRTILIPQNTLKLVQIPNIKPLRKILLSSNHILIKIFLQIGIQDPQIDTIINSTTIYGIRHESMKHIPINIEFVRELGHQR